ncbi:UNVERIFIED_CONTAM: hypothetical protein Sradi_5306200 [Sesamum radiatum]|uniref:Uncharacterized protein n=1 Tax=Sesamum radiatum TaxID=300843 RepID=A0AAW2LMD5_SESRA
MSSSNFNSSSDSMFGSSVTSPRPVNVPPTPVTTVGPSRVLKSQLPPRASPSEENPTQAKYQDMLLRNP